MESQINFKIAQENCQLLMDLDKEKILNIARASREQLLNFLEANSPRKMISIVGDLLEPKEADELSPFAAARLFGCGHVRSRERSQIARKKHREAMKSGQYESLLNSCNNAPEGTPLGLASMFKAEILEQIALLEASIHLENYWSQNPNASDAESHKAYYSYDIYRSYMRAAAESRKVAISLGISDLKPDLFIDLRSLYAREEMLAVFKEIVLSGDISARRIKGLIESVIQMEDQMVEVLKMINFAVANGYPEAVNAINMMWDCTYRDPRIRQSDFYMMIDDMVK